MSTLPAFNSDGDGEVSQLVETVATTKVCPFTMQPVTAKDSYTINDGGNGFVPGQYAVQMTYNCVGSRCMAWEYTKEIDSDFKPLPLTNGYCKLVEERMQC